MLNFSKLQKKPKILRTTLMHCEYLLLLNKLYCYPLAILLRKEYKKMGILCCEFIYFDFHFCVNYYLHNYICFRCCYYCNSCYIRFTYAYVRVPLPAYLLLLNTLKHFSTQLLSHIAINKRREGDGRRWTERACEGAGVRDA